MNAAFELGYLSLEQATRASGGHVERLMNRWWVHLPGKGLAFVCWPDGRTSPQCHEREEVTRALVSNLFPDCDARFLSDAYVSTDGKGRITLPRSRNGNDAQKVGG